MSGTTFSPIPNFTAVAGLVPAIEAAGIFITVTDDANGNHIWMCSNVSGAQAIAASFDGTAWAKTNYLGTGKLDQLNTFAQSYFNLFSWVSTGTLTSITGSQVSSFLASATNNYRRIRNLIAAATTIAQVAAIDVTAGWPTNP